MNRILKFTLIGCSGLIGLFILLGIVGAMLGGGGSPEQGDQPQQQQPREKPKQEEPKQQAEQEQAEQEEEPGIEERLREAEQEQQQQRQRKSDGAAESGEAESDAVLLRVSGPEGEQFSGSYGNVDTQRSVDGTVPAEYEQEVDTGFLSGDAVSATWQKMSPGDWTLKAEIVYKGEVVKETTTSAEYGVVNLAWSPAE